MEMCFKFDNSWFSWNDTEVLHDAKFTWHAKRVFADRGGSIGCRTFWYFGQWEFMCMALCCKCQTLRLCVCACVCVCAAYQSLHRALFGALNFSWRPRRAEETGWRVHCALFPIRSQWSRKLKTFSLQSIKNNGRRQRNHSPSAKRRRMQYAAPPPSIIIFSPLHQTVARIKLICMCICMYV